MAADRGYLLARNLESLNFSTMNIRPDSTGRPHGTVMETWTMHEFPLDDDGLECRLALEQGLTRDGQTSSLFPCPFPSYGGSGIDPSPRSGKCRRNHSSILTT